VDVEQRVARGGRDGGHDVEVTALAQVDDALEHPRSLARRSIRPHPSDVSIHEVTGTVTA
jgi:hypothetical protein